MSPAGPGTRPCPPEAWLGLVPGAGRVCAGPPPGGPAPRAPRVDQPALASVGTLLAEAFTAVAPWGECRRREGREAREGAGADGGGPPAAGPAAAGAAGAAVTGVDRAAGAAGTAVARAAGAAVAGVDRAAVARADGTPGISDIFRIRQRQ
ncbi:hypothetical protein GCM10010259_69660 [Streptomyces daghestanicus]|uniref:Uncharacterized protein n=1 Tax=Streptomyces daghestanicus TaxID=66885 RepID=A0ABQ3Q880_9ACTN|nr:hypothetical protein GCM10010259_69660 [Streptomyces daghestanicus]GHI33473.1 hypothetical protein Sdagh_52030 [Streptomyces daghestanicus]